MAAALPRGFIKLKQDNLYGFLVIHPTVLYRTLVINKWMPKIVDHDQYRATLLEAATGVLAQRGYSSISMREIAAELGVSTGTLYHYFPNKEALFRSVMLSLSERDELLASVKVGSSDSLEVLFALAGQHEDYFRQHVQLMVDFLQVQGQGNNQEVQAVALRYRQIVTELTGLPESQVTLILSQILGLVLLRMLENPKESFVQQAKPLQTLLQNAK